MIIFLVGGLPLVLTAVSWVGADREVGGTGLDVEGAGWEVGPLLLVAAEADGREPPNGEGVLLRWSACIAGLEIGLVC